jgi:hypothetical protein
LLALAILSGCFSWTEDSQGNLKSFGLPGVPVWTDKSSNSSTAASNGGAQGIAEAPPLDPVAAELVADAGSNGMWLTELNKWREDAGVGPVGENARLSQGSALHARYLVQEGPSDAARFYAYTSAIGAAGHAEDSGRPSFTPEGAEAAGGGKRTLGVMQVATIWFSDNEQNDIRELLIARFIVSRCWRRGRRLPVTAPLAVRREGQPRSRCAAASIGRR